MQNESTAPPSVPATTAKSQGEPSDSQAVAIDVVELNSWYGSFQALHSVTLRIPERRVTALIGPSGCGKSTLLRWFNRMNDTIPSARATGTARMGELDLLARSTDVVDLRRRIGIVFQKPNPFPKSIFDNVAFGPRLHMRCTRSQLQDIVEWSLRKAAVWDEVKDRLSSLGSLLSGGQQQRLTIARALSQEPEMLLLDEFSIAVDPVTTMRIEDVLKELRQEMTIILVTNLVQQARRLADRTALFLDGTCVEIGVTEDLFTGEVQDQRTRDYVEGRFG